MPLAHTSFGAGHAQASVPRYHHSVHLAPAASQVMNLYRALDKKRRCIDLYSSRLRSTGFIISKKVNKGLRLVTVSLHLFRRLVYSPGGRVVVRSPTGTPCQPAPKYSPRSVSK